MNSNKNYLCEIFLVFIILIIFIILYKKNVDSFSNKVLNDSGLPIESYTGRDCPFFFHSRYGDVKPVFLMYYDKKTRRQYIAKKTQYTFFLLEPLDKYEEDKTLILSDLNKFYLQKNRIENRTSIFRLFYPNFEFYQEVTLNQVCEDSSKEVKQCGGTPALYIIKKKGANTNEFLKFGSLTYSGKTYYYAIFSNEKDISEDNKTFFFKCYLCDGKEDTTFTDIVDKTYLEGGNCFNKRMLRYVS